MFVEFEKLSPHSRIWIYQSDRAFTTEEMAILSDQTTRFIQQWTSHGSNLKASFTVQYNHFLVLGVDQGYSEVSGCSIDSSVHFVQELEKLFNIDLINKMNVSFKHKNHISILKMSVFKQYLSANKITSKTIVFNNMVHTKQSFETDWEIPLEKSWHRRFLVS